MQSCVISNLTVCKVTFNCRLQKNGEAGCTSCSPNNFVGGQLLPLLPPLPAPIYHRQHAARLFQTTPYDRLFLSNSWAARCISPRRQVNVGWRLVCVTGSWSRCDIPSTLILSWPMEHTRRHCCYLCPDCLRVHVSSPLTYCWLDGLKRCAVSSCLGGCIVERWTRDRKVGGSTTGRGAIKSTRSTQTFIPTG